MIILDPLSLTGQFISSPIQPSSFKNREDITLGGSRPSGTQISYSILDCATSTPISGYIDISSLNNSSFSLSGLNRSLYPCIKIAATLSRPTLSSPRPSLTNITINRSPYPLFIVNTLAPAIKQSADIINVKVSFSNSFVNDKNVVLRSPLPTTGNG